MKKFRLPRKEKKKLKKNGFFLYPKNDEGYLVGFPYRNQKDYDAYKSGELDNFFSRIKKRKNSHDDLDNEIYISDEKLKEYVYDIMAKGYKAPSLYLLLQAKTHEKAKVAYFNFINAYHKDEAGDYSFGNICCLSIDLAKKLLKEK